MSLTLREASRRFTRLGLWLLLSAALLSFAAPSAQATFVPPPPPDPVINIGVTNADGQSGTWSTTTGTDGKLQEWDNQQVWSTDGTHTLLATFDWIKAQNDNDPTAGVFFGVVAGNSVTSFTISSGVVSFAPILNPNNATASASVTVTDRNGNGSNLTGNFAGNTLSYQALYSGSTVFTTLVSPVSTPGPFDSNSSTASPVIANIPGSVSSIEGVFSFKLSANDFGSGTSIFSVPEPSSVCLAAVGALGLAFFARRRRA